MSTLPPDNPESVPDADNALKAREWPLLTVQPAGSDHVAEVVMNRPPHNFFNLALIDQLVRACEALSDVPTCRAIVLAASGTAFCAGADLGTGSNDGSAEFTEEGFRTTTGVLYERAVRLFECPVPIIAAVEGPAIGGGLGLALVADVRVIGPRARFAANFVKLGLHQGFGLSVTLPELVGRQAASQLLLSGRRVGPEEALALGLADVLTDAASVRAEARRQAAEIAANAPLAVRSVRATLREGLAERVAAVTQHELKEQQWLRATADAAEGIRAVAERRPGRFTGR